MSENTRNYRRFVDEALIGGDVSVVDELADPKFVEHEELPPGVPEGREGVKAFVQMYHQAFSNIGAEIQDMVEDGDNVWARFTMRGTHTGDFMGIPATNKSFEITAMDCVRFQDGKAVEHWGVTDTASMLMQLGVMPEPQA